MHAAVIWRWRSVVLAGLALAIVLTFLSLVRVSFAHGFSYRQGKTWRSSETLLLTQSNCPISQVSCPTGQGSLTVTPLYASIANSGVVRTRVFPGGHATAATGDYVASAVTDSSTGAAQVLPLFQFDGLGSTPAQAARIARQATTVFLAYLNDTSNSARIPQSKRVVVQVVSPATVDNAKVVRGRKLTVPIVIFLAVLIITLGLAYLLENLFPHSRGVMLPGARPERVVDSENGAEPTPEPVESPKPASARAAAEAEAQRRQ